MITRRHARPGEALRWWTFWLPMIAVTAVFSAARLAGLFSDLWLDEIWAVSLAKGLKSPIEILKTPHEINHPLYTLHLYLLGPSAPEWAYRLPSFLAGGATVWLAGLIGRRQFQALRADARRAEADTAGIITAVLIGASYMLVHFASEARGYSLAVCFSLLSLYALWRGSERFSAWAVVYWFAIMLAVLGHAVAVHMLVASVVWSGILWLRSERPWWKMPLKAAWWYALPLVGISVFYALFLRNRVVGGAQASSMAGVLAELCVYTLGLPVHTAAWVALSVAAILVLVALIVVGSRRADIAAFYAVAMIVSPTLVIWGTGYVYPLPRHFIVCAAAGLLLVGAMLGLIRTRARRNSLVVVAVAAFVIANGVHVQRLWRFGRGQYQAALRHIVDETPTPIITVSGDHDLRNSFIVSYYGPRVAPGRVFEYFSPSRLDRWPHSGVGWILTHRFDMASAPVPVLYDRLGNGYRLDREYPYAGLSGWRWILYRNVTLTSGSPHPSQADQR